jgi:hypothetical protein
MRVRVAAARHRLDPHARHLGCDGRRRPALPVALHGHPRIVSARATRHGSSGPKKSWPRPTRTMDTTTAPAAVAAAGSAAVAVAERGVAAAPAERIVVARGLVVARPDRPAQLAGGRGARDPALPVGAHVRHAVRARCRVARPRSPGRPDRPRRAALAGSLVPAGVVGSAAASRRSTSIRTGCRGMSASYVRSPRTTRTQSTSCLFRRCWGP